MNWDLYPNFTEQELRCKATGLCKMEPDFMARLQRLRWAWGQPMTITSGYRDKAHPIESKKAVPGVHALGRAVDIAVQGADALHLLELALAHGFTGIGIQQKGAGRFIHVDDAPASSTLPRPMIWSY